jgi:DNA-directed RNA polymerase specialized sigma24 family protein
MGDPALYFCGVARNVWREHCKVRRHLDPPPPGPDDATEAEFECLEECMSHLLPKNREMILEYYGEEKHAKIEHRRQLALRFGLDMNALRIRLHRIRSSVGDCVRECVNREKGANAAPGSTNRPGLRPVPQMQSSSRPTPSNADFR